MGTPDPIPGRTRSALILLASAAALGIGLRAAVVLLPGRLDIAIGAGMLIIAAAALAACRAVGLPPRLWQLAVPAVLATAAMIWRDSPMLFTLDLAVFGSVMLLLLPNARAPRVARAGVTDYARAGIMWGCSSAIGPLPLLTREIRWSELPAGPVTGRVRRVAVGLAAAVPCLVVFGSLFRSADPAYDRVLGRFVSFEFAPVAEHAAVVLVCSWLIAGYLWLAFRTPPPRRLLPAHGRAGEVELIILLAAILVLFVSFKAFQVSYLFGGADAMAAMGLSHAEYARRGFFELVTVAVIALPLLLAADWALAPSAPRVRRRLRWIEGALVAVLFVLLASALDRMRLYTAMYGLTELRLYTTAFMGWLAMLLGWFVATVLRGRRTRFAWGAVTAAWLIVGGLHMLNPDALIVNVNADRNGAFDAAYVAELSADALPSLLAAAQATPAPLRCAFAAEAVAPLAAAVQHTDRWTLGRVVARRALERNDLLARCG